jgi:tryptophan-rich hypothetical protein
VNQINPKKLLNSKWTAVTPKDKEKHFTVIEVDFDEEGSVITCCIEAVMSQRGTLIQWQELKQPEKWLQGWK